MKLLSLLVMVILILNAFGAVAPNINIIVPDDYDLVVIAPSLFSSELQSLIEHKNNHGMSTVLKTVEEIYEEYEGCDKSEQIKYCIKDALDNWGVKYVLLVGGIDKLPMRKSYVQCSWYSFEYVITDLYYSDIYDANKSFCSWDSNNNNKFGEFTWAYGQ